MRCKISLCTVIFQRKLEICSLFKKQILETILETPWARRTPEISPYPVMLDEFLALATACPRLRYLQAVLDAFVEERPLLELLQGEGGTSARAPDCSQFPLGRLAHHIVSRIRPHSK